MTPSSSSNNVANCRGTYAVLTGQRLHAELLIASDVVRSNPTNVVIGQDGPSVPFTTGTSLGMCVPGISEASRHATGGNRIIDVVLLSTNRQMGRLDTSRIATARAQMANNEARGDRQAIRDLPGDPVRNRSSFTKLDFGVILFDLADEWTLPVNQKSAPIRVPDIRKGQDDAGIECAGGYGTPARAVPRALAGPSRRDHELALTDRADQGKGRVVRSGTLRRHRVLHSLGVLRRRSVVSRSALCRVNYSRYVCPLGRKAVNGGENGLDRFLGFVNALEAA